MNQNDPHDALIIWRYASLGKGVFFSQKKFRPLSTAANINNYGSRGERSPRRGGWTWSRCEPGPHLSVKNSGEGAGYRGGGAVVAQLPRVKAFSNARPFMMCHQAVQREHTTNLHNPFALSTQIILNSSITSVALVKEKKQDQKPTQPFIPLHRPTTHRC